MAILGQWSGASVAQFPTTSWTAPNGIFATQDRNDGSAYSFNASTSTLTLPSSGLADGYLIVAGYETLITHNNRLNNQGRFIQASGTGNFVSAATSGYARNNANNHAYVKTWAFIDNPSASATIQFQWKRDVGTGTPAGSTAEAYLQVIPLYYSNVGVYSSADTGADGGTSVHKLTGWSATVESDTAAIELATDTVTVKGNNKRYLVLGGQFWENLGGRTQRWHTLGVDGTYLDAASGYSYIRDGNNDEIGEMFTWLVETATADVTLDQGVWRGPTIGTFPNTGASVSGNTTGSNPQHAWVVLELNDGAKVFRTTNSAQQDANQTTAVDLDIASVGDIDFNDSDTFTRGSDTGIDVAATTDVLLGSNVNGGYASSSSTRATSTAKFTINGAQQASSLTGDYGRGDQGSQDTWGWGANGLSFHAVTSGDDVGIEVQRTGDGGPIDVLSGYVGFWGIDLDTLEAAASTARGQLSWAQLRYIPGSNSETTINASTEALTITENAASLSLDRTIDAATEALTIATLQASVAQTIDVTVNASAEALSITENPASITFDALVNASTEALTVTTFQATIDASINIEINANTEALTLTTLAAGVSFDVGIGATTEALGITLLQAGIVFDAGVSANSETLTITAQPAAVNYSANSELNANAEALTLTPQPATVTYDVTLGANSEALSITTLPASVGVVGAVNAQTANLTISTLSAKIVAKVGRVYAGGSPDPSWDEGCQKNERDRKANEAERRRAVERAFGQIDGKTEETVEAAPKVLPKVAKQDVARIAQKSLKFNGMTAQLRVLERQVAAMWKAEQDRLRQLAKDAASEARRQEELEALRIAKRRRDEEAILLLVA